MICIVTGGYRIQPRMGGDSIMRCEGRETASNRLLRTYLLCLYTCSAARILAMGAGCRVQDGTYYGTMSIILLYLYLL